MGSNLAFHSGLHSMAIWVWKWKAVWWRLDGVLNCCKKRWRGSSVRVTPSWPALWAAFLCPKTWAGSGWGCLVPCSGLFMGWRRQKEKGDPAVTLWLTQVKETSEGKFQSSPALRSVPRHSSQLHPSLREDNSSEWILGKEYQELPWFYPMAWWLLRSSCSHSQTTWAGNKDLDRAKLAPNLIIKLV